MGYSSQLSILQRRPTIPTCPRRPTLSNWHILLCQDVPECARMYGGEPTGRPLPATSTATVMSDLLHNIMSENASSSDERPINRDL